MTARYGPSVHGPWVDGPEQPERLVDALTQALGQMVASLNCRYERETMEREYGAWWRELLLRAIQETKP